MPFFRRLKVIFFLNQSSSLPPWSSRCSGKFHMVHPVVTILSKQHQTVNMFLLQWSLLLHELKIESRTNYLFVLLLTMSEESLLWNNFQLWMRILIKSENHFLFEESRKCNMLAIFSKAPQPQKMSSIALPVVFAYAEQLKRSQNAFQMKI